MSTVAFVDLSIATDEDLGILIRRALNEVADRNGINTFLQKLTEESNDPEENVYFNEYTQVMNGGMHKNVMRICITKEGQSKSGIEARKIAQNQILHTLFDPTV